MKLDKGSSGGNLPLLLLVISAASVFGKPVTSKGKVPSDEDRREQLALYTQSTCQGIRNIDDYVKRVVIMTPMKEIDHKEFSHTANNFNNDLEIAKGHTPIWNTGRNSIRKGLRRTFLWASQFEPNFNARYVINQARAELMQNDTELTDMVIKVKDVIRDLEEGLEKDEKALRTAAEQKNTLFFEYMKARVDATRAKLEKEKKFLRERTISKQIKEFVEFLSFMKHQSDIIITEAEGTSTKIETFRDHLSEDKVKFETHKQEANQTIYLLKEKDLQKQKKLEECVKKIAKHEKKIETRDQTVYSFHRRLSEITDVYQTEATELREMVREAKKGSWVEDCFLGIFFCQLTRKYDATAKANEKKYTEMLVKAETKFEQTLKLALQAIEVNNSERDKYVEEIEDLMKEIEILRNETNNYIFLNTDLEILLEKTSHLSEDTEKALAGVNIIHDVFQDVSITLDIMINSTSRVKTNTEKMENLQFLNVELSTLRGSWEGIYDQVIDLNECRQKVLLKTQ